MKKLTLVQKAVRLEEYQDMILKGQLPLVVKLTEEEIRNGEFPNNPFSEFYFSTFSIDGLQNQFLNEDHLREAIEDKRIFIPEFIDLEGKTKFVDYISKSDSVDFGGHIVFRNRKRILKGEQSKESIQKNHSYVGYVKMQCGGASGFVPMFWSGFYEAASEELFSLCTEADYHFHKKQEEPAIQKRI